MDHVLQLKECPRCGDYGLEKLRTHAFCAGCNYFADEKDEATPLIPFWAKKQVVAPTEPDDEALEPHELSA